MTAETASSPIPSRPGPAADDQTREKAGGGACRPDSRGQAGLISLGIDIGGTKIEGVALDRDRRVLATCRLPSRQGSQAVHDDTVTAARRLMSLAEVGDRRDGITLGLGIPGRIDSLRGTVDDAVNLGIGHMDLGPGVSRTLGIPVQVENDVNIAALGAACQSHSSLVGSGERGRGGDDATLPQDMGEMPQTRSLPPEKERVVVFINLGTGLAAGIIRNGSIEHGASGAVGEIGHIPADFHDFPCKCGQTGCLETVASGSAVEAMWPGVSHPLPDMIDKARQGDAHAKESLAIIGHGIAMAVQIVALTVDPSLIILGGGMTKTGQPLLDLVDAELDKSARASHFIASLDLPARIRLAPPDLPIGAIGAALAGRKAGRLQI